MTQQTKLSIDEMRILEEEHVLLSTSETSRKRKISATFFTPPSPSPSTASSSVGSTASLSYRSYAVNPLANLEVPIEEESPEGFQFLGFTAEVAQTLFHEFSTLPPDGPLEDHILQFSYSHANKLNLPQFSSLLPADALSRIGIKSSLRDAILDPEFKDIFETQSLPFWVKDSLRINYWTLVHLQRKLKEHVKYASKRKIKQAKRGSISDIFPSTESQPSQPPTATLNTASSCHHFPKGCVVVSDAGPLLDDHIVLYKGKCAEEMFEERPWIRDNGTLSMGALASQPFRDFNYSSIAYYFTPERETAEKYRQYAAQRNKDSETWTLRFQIPKAVFDSWRSTDLWYGRDWREFVWHCRTREPPPPRFDRYRRPGPDRMDVIRGAICTAVSQIIMRIRQEDIHTLMTQQEVVMKNGQQNAIQVALLNDDVVEQFGREVKGKIDVEVHPPVNALKEEEPSKS